MPGYCLYDSEEINMVCWCVWFFVFCLIFILHSYPKLFRVLKEPSCKKLWIGRNSDKLSKHDPLFQHEYKEAKPY